jgi:hypothetical protein
VLPPLLSNLRMDSCTKQGRNSQPYPRLVTGSVEEDNSLLGSTELAKEYMMTMKERLNDAIHLESIPSHWPGEWQRVGNPRALLDEIHADMKQLVLQMQAKGPEFDRSGMRLCERESLASFIGRWTALSARFYDSKTERYSAERVPDIFDYIKYDSMHNLIFLDKLDFDAKAFYDKVSKIADLVIPQEVRLRP